MSRSGRHEERLLQGAGAVFSRSQAAALLPVADSTAFHWLTGQGLVRFLAGKPVVIWGDVLDALREPSPKPRARIDQFRRAGLPLPKVDL